MKRLLPAKPRRFVSAPCSHCGDFHKLNELKRVGKMLVCSSCFSKKK